MKIIKPDKAKKEGGTIKRMRIAVTGKMRSGKDTVGDYLVRQHRFKNFAFGDAIRSICQELFPEALAKGKPRYLYQAVGQGMRTIESDVWINNLFKQIDKESPETNLVVTDLRQQNEYKALKQHGFIIVMVNSRLDNRIKRMNDCGDNFSIADLALVNKGNGNETGIIDCRRQP
ncbi:hypothetical protein Dtox_0843 [Desulfofarcimen acetoxidans DSM 771]|uniref:Uncharacterized protein n=1 Tax=Desulfofarcimen acetoxidans (strain ATCC 49208 / DSM 771 / KCTC 5769 / VKM B-1644 / 5575) TaxID=485916 RepID=C8W284_DESAS|nr:AAA family ATPase [Desulfofarcimen acetoxidans]ACV61748.1 hypothetical protein Dtox_0843 [Desulfofarcimen acetoxidans DSM 771]